MVVDVFGRQFYFVVDSLAGLDDAPPPAALAQAKDASNIGGSALLPQLRLVKLLCPWLHFVFALLCLLYI